MEWISVKDGIPKILKDSDYSKNVLAFCNGEIMVMQYCLIKDEHAIEIANMIGVSNNWHVLPIEDDMVTIQNENHRISIIDTPKRCYIEIERIVTNEKGNKFYTETSCESLNFVLITDRLRELGYALPYKGECLFELGIAIDATTIK